MRSLFCVVVWSLLVPAIALPQAATTGTIQGMVTTQGDVRLPGATVTVTAAVGGQVWVLLSGGDGTFRVATVPPGRYRLRASLPGFETTTVEVTVAGGKTTDCVLDLRIAVHAEVVEVVAAAGGELTAESISPRNAIQSRTLDQFVPSGGLQASLRLLASVIEVPGGVSIKGGRPNQASVQLGPMALIDPATGLSPIELPADAIESVSVLANPYAVEYGRFSSGLIVMQTRRAGDQWRARFNGVDPAFRTGRSSPIDILGLLKWEPRVALGGPLIKDRLFLEQTAQFRYRADEVASLAQSELHISKLFNSFTRLDANVTPHHALVATGVVFPGVLRAATLGTFTPREATVDVHTRAYAGGVTERANWSDALFSETTVQALTSSTEVLPQGSAPMHLLPQTTRGNFFSQQRRRTALLQVVESLSGARRGPGGLHLVKVGVDVLHSRYDGSSVSRPVFIERVDGTLARLLEFSGPTRQALGSTDVALYAQDRLQPNGRWTVEFGGRLDWDGVTRQLNVTPRLGVAGRLNESGSATLRGGIGLFFERTPSLAGVFDQFDSVLDTRFARDGVTPEGPPVRFLRVTDPLQTSRSRAYDLSYDHRLNDRWTFHVGGVVRDGRHELIVDPLTTGPTAGQLRLSSSGASSYRGADVSVRYVRGPSGDFEISYARSSAHGDLNALTSCFDTIPCPVVGANAYAPANADALNRLLARGRTMPTPRWLLLGILDWRSGLPYSAVNETLDFVSPRNSLRFPQFVRLELGIERRFQIFKLQPWIGVRVNNAAASFLPTDVQANRSSPDFGTFYNSEWREFRIMLRFER